MPIHPSRYKAVYQYLNQLSPVSEKTWRQVAEILEERTFEKQAFFAKEGRHEHLVGIILEGIFRSFIYNDNGSEFIKTFYTPIHFKTPISYLGAYTSLITGSINQINIQALTDAKILTCSYEQWLSLGQSNQEVAAWSAKLPKLFFMGKEKRVVQLSTLSTEQRYLLFRAEFPELENLISQYYIAQYIGITPTQLSRIRKKVFRS